MHAFNFAHSSMADELSTPQILYSLAMGIVSLPEPQQSSSILASLFSGSQFLFCPRFYLFNKLCLLVNKNIVRTVVKILQVAFTN